MRGDQWWYAVPVAVFAGGLLVLGLVGCMALAVPAAVTSACGVVSWGVPLVQAMNVGGKLNPNGQSILADAEQAVQACAAGNVPGTLAATAAGLTAILWPPAP